MMKCEFFTILLQKKLGSIINMVKKKKEKKENRPSGFLDILGFKNFFANEKLGFLLGIVVPCGRISHHGVYFLFHDGCSRSKFD